jgi:hypothetical protein
MLRFIQSVVWPFLFGKAAEELQQGAAVRFLDHRWCELPYCVSRSCADTLLIETIPWLQCKLRF